MRHDPVLGVEVDARGDDSGEQERDGKRKSGDCKDPFENCHAPSLTKSASENIALRGDLGDRAVILEDDCPIREIHYVLLLKSFGRSGVCPPCIALRGFG